jgi:hypothetical protein
MIIWVVPVFAECSVGSKMFWGELKSILSLRCSHLCPEGRRIYVLTTVKISALYVCMIKLAYILSAW